MIAHLDNSKTFLSLFGLFFGLLIIIMTFFSCSGSTKKETQLQGTVPESQTSQEKDAQFLVDAVEITMMEMQLGQLAQKKSTSAEVRDLGKKIEEGHHVSNKQLIGLAKIKMVTLPTITSRKAQEAYDKLNVKSNSDFDKAYCNMMVSEHKDAIALFEKTSENTKDPDIKAWALATLPFLKIHLNHALQCQKRDETI